MMKDGILNRHMELDTIVDIISAL